MEAVVPGFQTNLLYVLESLLFSLNTMETDSVEHLNSLSEHFLELVQNIILPRQQREAVKDRNIWNKCPVARLFDLPTLLLRTRLC